MRLCCDENAKGSIIELLLQEGYEDLFHFDDHPGILFLDTQRTPPRDVVIAVQRIDRHVPETAGSVWHVPDGWI